jgi:NAD(P)-dependent dehydrogenase (short-subunit alcohol dehydrogenase family)
MGFLEDRANLGGRVAVVVGGASGIGEAVTLALASAGVDVGFCDINAAATAATQGRVEALGRQGLARVTDATDPAALDAFYVEVARTFKQVDILVNVVGGVSQRPFLDATTEQCAADIHRNYGYVIQSVRKAVPLIQRGGRGGSIINFTTIEAHRGAAGFSVYAGAKAAVTNFSRSLAVELGSSRIRVNVIAPDTTPSEGNYNALPATVRAEMAQADPRMMQQALRMYIPLEEPPSTQDLANAVLFLASDLSRSITGTTVHVDGGTWAASGFINWPGQGFLPVPLASVQRRLFASDSPD